VILTDQDDKILYYRNLDNEKASDPVYLDEQLGQMKKTHQPLVVELGDNKRNYIYYKESLLLQQLSIYPYLQLSVIILFMLISYVAFSASRKAEQNKVWLGLSRETAHQLGTPTSSLMAWIEILKDKIQDQDILNELEKDVQRLYTITERFSKIGSQPKLEITNLKLVINEVVTYMKVRLPKAVGIENTANSEEYLLPLNKNLFGWVIENLSKNSLDAISSPGYIKINMSSEDGKIIVDVSDNGKGMTKRSFKRIFKPGFTTKLRGWGLGLSLAKRIIEEYHRGKIFVLQSELHKGTTIRIILPMSK
jgi:signal transduction histidine kinase